MDNACGSDADVEIVEKEEAAQLQDRKIWSALREVGAERLGRLDDRMLRRAWSDVFPSLTEKAERPFRAFVKRKVSEADASFEVETLSGSLEGGCNVQVLPIGARMAIKVLEGGADSGTAIVALSGDGDVVPGSVLCDARFPASQSDMFSLNVLWLGEEPMYAGRTYRISTVSGDYSALVGKLKNRIDPETFLPLATKQLEHGDVGQVEIELDGSLIFDTHDFLSPLAHILFRDDAGRRVLGFGIIRFALRRASNIRWQQLELDKEQRAAGLGQKPLVLWFTGLSGCGKSTVASLLEKKLHAMGRHTYILDGDNVRHGLCKDLGFTKADRVENMRRVTEVAKLMTDAGLIVLVTFISPFRDERNRARKSFEDGEFVEIFVDTPLEICEARDIKGLYAKARAGLIRNFTGIDSPYEPPENPEIRLPGAELSVEQMADRVISWLQDKRLI